MNRAKSIILIIAIVGICAGFWYLSFYNKPHILLYKTEKPEYRTIKHIVSTSGVIEIKEIMHVGSIQPGFVKEIYVQENQCVKKGQLLALIDTAKNDSEVIAGQHRVVRAQKEMDYQKVFFQRQKALYNSGQLSLDNYQKYKKEYEKSIEDVRIEEASLRKATLEYESTKIKAPDDGIIIAVYATKGMIANDISNIVLFDIAQDPTKMKVTLDIDESEIGHVKVNQKVRLSPHSFPDMHIKTIINEVSYIQKTGISTSSESASYKAFTDIDNRSLLFRPGMIVNAKITINKAKNVISLNGLAFHINEEILKKIAHKIKFDFVPLDRKEQRQVSHVNDVVKFVWVVQGNRFIQKAVTIGLTDSMFWEIKSGLTITDQVIVDLEEIDEMEEIYKKWFSGSL